MPKKTAYSRSGAQRGKTRQKSFELVRSASEPEVQVATESRVQAEVAEREAAEEEVVEEREAGEEEERKKRVGMRAGAAASRSSVPATPAVQQDSAHTSAKARMAARRQAAQRTQRAPASLIVAENYSYVRKDLIFVLILAIIMFSAIIALHFILGS
ncbi:MAG TPA: hypothetical protein VGF67_29665 [Ktedonobacteraceae bacterium]|jgi:cobalamin biosynthesis Mg chelatase CobN